MLFRKILLASASLALLACTGVLEPRGAGGLGGPITPEPPPPPPPDANAAQLFDATVAPLMAKCVGCHIDGGTAEPFFLATNGDDHYPVITANYPNEDVLNTTPQDSRVWAKGQTPHAGTIQWEPTELETIAAWINKEAQERVGGGGGDAVADPTPEDDCGGGVSPGDCALEKFGRCFTVANWQFYEPYQVANVQSASGQCSQCHDEVSGGFFANGDSNDTYDAWKDLPTVTKLVAANADGSVYPSYRMHNKGQEGGDHPAYTLDQATTDAIDGFVTDTLTLFGDGACQDEVLP